MTDELIAGQSLTQECLSDNAIIVENLTMTYDEQVIQKNLNFTVKRNDIFVIMGNSGSGKSTLMRAMTGLDKPSCGEVYFSCKGGHNGYWQAPEEVQLKMMEQYGVMFQNGALFSSMTLLDNVSLRLVQSTKYSLSRIRKIAAYKLALVGLKGFEHYFPSEISGGMQKRVAIARAMAMDPPILFFDEPSAGLDPVSSKMLDDLLLELRNSMGITMVVVTHELDSIFSIANEAIFLDHEQKTIIARGNPKTMILDDSNKQVQTFLRRGKELTKGNAL
ncbi:MAG: ATP-binding cassette domain-containing protein [gamma proteobacterium symbiont of Bathyaustriella thionipta]|nr:ATP-binding cassette domain-containing protein [gamma proteobacterium symbiont of Bathyaustriella thionipta]MCU7949166.1 ATP-binding cassette domain-containing protein [gamma proteobacterium symbiont of Bathyaustriella thionipta]MCU7953354.1 ATP-binding cassette domain-containing protein [gamma proteobacterium symbiont of Bathyaustriella thionipta]MCU7955738.1 ATP-binding cassette domain-containing protein [gamma proteobacterium symbiont of Bathyaustriella thionipta]MCU7965643.1 ATP-binding 